MSAYRIVVSYDGVPSDICLATFSSYHAAVSHLSKELERWEHGKQTLDIIDLETGRMVSWTLPTSAQLLY